MATLVYFRALHNTYGRNLKSPLNGQAATLAKDLQCFCKKETFSKTKQRSKQNHRRKKEVFLMTHLMIFFFK